MDIELIKLYETGKSKKYKLPGGIAETFVLRITQIEAVASLDDLKNSKAFALSSRKPGSNLFSARIDDNYLLELEVVTKGNFQIINIINLYSQN